MYDVQAPVNILYGFLFQHRGDDWGWCLAQVKHDSAQGKVGCDRSPKSSPDKQQNTQSSKAVTYPSTHQAKGYATLLKELINFLIL